MGFSFLKAAALLPSGLLLSSPSLLWIVANVIFIWLLSSYRHFRIAYSAIHEDGVSAAVDRFYPSEEHDLLFAPVIAPDAVVTVTAVSKRQTREARTAPRSPRRPADGRPRMRKKPAVEESPRAVAANLAPAEAMPVDKKVDVEERPRAVAADEAKHGGKKAAGEERPRTIAADEAKYGGKKAAGEERPRTIAADEAKYGGKKAAGEERSRAVPADKAKHGGKKAIGEERPRAIAADQAKHSGKKAAVEERPRVVAAEAKPGGSDADDLSMDSAWQSIVRSGAARPVAVRKSETWGGEELPRMQHAAKKAVARREMRKSATMVPASPPHPSMAAPVAAKQGWRTRDVLVMAHGELLSRAESFIRRQHENLRLQRQESEQRQAIERERRRHGALIRI